LSLDKEKEKERRRRREKKGKLFLAKMEFPYHFRVQ
jgi:hypothetical protein